MGKTSRKEPKINLNTFLRDARVKAGLSQGKVAKALGYSSPQFVSNWERGLADPPVITLKKLAAIYSIPIDDMFDVVLKCTVQKVTEELREKFGGR